MPGLVKVVVKKNFVGVVAEKPWQAIQAANKLKVNWSAGIGMPSHADFYNYLRTQQPTRDTLLVNSKDVFPFVAEYGTEGIDISSLLTDEAHVLLMANGARLLPSTEGIQLSDIGSSLVICHLRSALAAQTPAKQSACSSILTESAFACVWLLACCSAFDTFPRMPS